MIKFYSLTILIILLSGCNQKIDKIKNSSEDQIEKTDNTLNKSVVLVVKPNVFKLSLLPDILKVKMTNNTEDTITTGLSFRIENLVNSKWKEVTPKELFFNSIGFQLIPSDTKNFDIQLFKDSIKYEPGKYRIVKDYLKSDYVKTKEKKYSYAEYIIE